MSRISDAIDALTVAAEHDYRTALGGETACSIHRDGRVTGGISYHEGRLVALREAQRILETAPADDWHDDVVALRDRWATDLETRKASRVSTPPWIGYTTGGFEAAAEALAAIDAEQ